MQAELELFLDLDGVLVDFVRGFQAISGGKLPKAFPESAMWDLIQKQPNFWEDLEPMADAFHLWELVKGYPHLSILTCPSIRDYARAKPGKLYWVNLHLGSGVPVHFRHAQTKADLAAPNRILVDDWGKNVKAWEKAGGIGIHHRDAISTAERLMELGVVSREAVS